MKITKRDLLEFARQCDGCCIVDFDEHGDAKLFHPDTPPHSGTWTYFMSDEPDHFDYERYGIG